MSIKHLKTSDEPHDDRWHFLDFQDKAHEENYIEWKYFNFTQKNLSGYVMYYILDPEGKTKTGGGRLLVRVLKDGVIYGLIKKIDVEKIAFDTVSASVLMDGARIKEKSYDYSLSCKFDDFSWNLDYKQEVPSIESFININPGLMRWERMNWLVKMPRAKVVGEIRIGKDVFDIDGLGYSDTNWGEVMPFFSRYEWGQYNEENFSLVFGILYGLEDIKSNYFYFILGKQVTSIENAKCEVKHLEWEDDKDLGIKIPKYNSFSVKNDEYEIEFFTTLVHHDSPGIKVHPLLPSVVVSEQIVEYKGKVMRSGKIIHEFSGRGFEEWSGKTWKEVPVAF